jgi:hypothetical protein
VFCAAWLAMDAALIWRLFLSKHGADDHGSIEGLEISGPTIVHPDCRKNTAASRRNIRP